MPEVCRNAGACDVFILIESWGVGILTWIQDPEAQIIKQLLYCFWILNETVAPLLERAWVLVSIVVDTGARGLFFAFPWLEGMTQWELGHMRLSLVIYLVTWRCPEHFVSVLSLTEPLCWLVVQSTSVAIHIRCPLISAPFCSAELWNGGLPAVPGEVKFRGHYETFQDRRVTL